MSALIFYTTHTDIIIAMDTLAVCDQSGTPLLFTTKFYPVPHLRGVICGTGIGQFIIDWFVRVNTTMVVDDIPQLDCHTPTAHTPPAPMDTATPMVNTLIKMLWESFIFNRVVF